MLKYFISKRVFYFLLVDKEKKEIKNSLKSF